MTRYFSDLHLIIRDLINKLQKDLEGGESLSAEAEKAFFTFQDQFQDEGKKTMLSVTFLFKCLTS